MSAWTFVRRVSGRPIAILALALIGVIATAVLWRHADADVSLMWVIRTGTLSAQLTTAGTPRPIQSITYRSPLAGRDAEVIYLAPEGTRVRAGELLVQLDTTDLQSEAAQVRREVRQAQMDLQIAEVEHLDAQAAVKTASEGEGALAVDEARARFQAAQRRSERPREGYAQLKPLMEKGFITRNELGRVSDDLERVMLVPPATAAVTAAAKATASGERGGGLQPR